MATESKESIEHHIQTYIRVFIALGVLTVITVYDSYLNVSLLKLFYSNDGRNYKRKFSFGILYAFNK